MADAPSRRAARPPFLPALLGILLAAAACRPAPDPLPAAPDPAALPAPDVRIRQSLWLRAGDRSFLGQGVVVKRGARLDLLLLSPTGQRLLSVRDDGGAVTAEARAAGLDRLDPRLLLDDVRWAFLDGCPPPPEGPADAPAPPLAPDEPPPPAAPSPLRCTRDGRAVVESRDPRTGDLSRRQVARGNSVIVLEFQGWSGAGRDRRPGRVTLRDDARGYGWEASVDAWEPPDPVPPEPAP